MVTSKSSITNRTRRFLISVSILAVLFSCGEQKYRIDIENRSQYSLDSIFLNFNGGVCIALAPGEISQIMTFSPPVFTLSEPQLLVYVQNLHDSAGSYVHPYGYALGSSLLHQYKLNRIVIAASHYPCDQSRVNAWVEDGNYRPLELTRKDVEQKYDDHYPSPVR